MDIFLTSIILGVTVVVVVVVVRGTASLASPVAAAAEVGERKSLRRAGPPGLLTTPCSIAV